MLPLPLRLALALLATVAALPLAAAPAPGWQAGTGREKITPPAGVWMTGYASRDRPADGAAQDLWVKALALADSEGRRGVVLTLDLCGITREITDAVAAELERRYQVPRASVLVNVSHTHCSPWLSGNLMGLRPLTAEGIRRGEEYTRTLAPRMIAAAAQALEHLGPATVSWAEDEAHFGFNRRENAEPQISALRAAGKVKGPFEPRVPVLAVRGAGGQLQALLVSYACHNTTLSDFQWHGDYAGSAQVELERRHPGALALFAIGCGADINPGPRRTREMADQHGKDLADAVDRALARKARALEPRLRTGWQDVTLRFSRLPTAEEIETARTKQQPNRAMHQGWAEAVAERQRLLGDKALEYSYPVQAWRLGSLAWVALGGEVVIDYSIRLRRETPGDLWVLGYSNDVMAYIPSERVLAEGRYEGETSMIPYGKPSKWAPGLEEQIVSTAQTLLKRTAE